MSKLIESKPGTIKQLFTGMGAASTISRLEVKSVAFNQEFTPNFDTLDGKKLLKTTKGTAEIELLIKYEAGYSILYQFDYESTMQNLSDKHLSDKDFFIETMKNGHWQTNFFSKPSFRANSILINNDCDENLVNDIRNLPQLKNIDIKPTGKFEFLASRGDLVVSPNQRENAEILMIMDAVLTRNDEFDGDGFDGSIRVELDKRIRSQLLAIID